MGENVSPADSLWDSGTKMVTSISATEFGGSGDSPDILLSFIILVFFVGLVVFSRELLTVIPNVIKSTFNFKNHYKIEEKLSLSNMRNVVFVISLIYFPMIVTIMARGFIEEQLSLYLPLFLLFSFIALVSVGLAKKLILLLLAWLNKDKLTFSFIEKVGFNHVIIASIITFPALLMKLLSDDISGELLVYTMAFSILPIYILYLVRGYQIIIGQHYSHFFYILYLCGAEILPIVLIVHFILSL